MAILVEEKKEDSGIFNIVVWVVILTIILAAVYYIFFKQPQLVEFTVSPSFQNIQQLSQINIGSDKLVNNTTFQTLKQYITVAQPENIGRPNPFLGF